MLAESSDRSDELVPAKRVQQLGHGNPWIATCSSLLDGTLSDGGGSEVDRIEYELIWVLGFNIVAFQHVIRKVSQVVRHNRLRTGSDGGSEHVSVSRIGEIEAWFEMLESGYEAVGHCSAHQLSSSLERFGIQVRAAFENAVKALVQNAL